MTAPQEAKRRTRRLPIDISRRWLVVMLVLVTLGAGCGSDTTVTSTTDQDGTTSSTATTVSREPETLRLYTTVTEATVNAVVEAFAEDHPEVTVEVFRAPTGEVAARIAAELREGGLQADVLWLTDPLSMQQYEIDGLLRSWTPAEIDAVPESYRSSTFFGTRILNMVIVHQPGMENPPIDWSDLPEVEGVVAIPDPSFAGSAFGALAFFEQTEGFGLEFYQSLKDNGAVQVQSPTDVVNGVAEGLYVAGMTLDQGAQAAIDDGSPLIDGLAGVGSDCDLEPDRRGRRYRGRCCRAFRRLRPEPNSPRSHRQHRMAADQDRRCLAIRGQRRHCRLGGGFRPSGGVARFVRFDLRRGLTRLLSGPQLERCCWPQLFSSSSCGHWSSSFRSRLKS